MAHPTSLPGNGTRHNVLKDPNELAIFFEEKTNNFRTVTPSKQRAENITFALRSTFRDGVSELLRLSNTLEAH
jgi:hypothetical protein